MNTGEGTEGAVTAPGPRHFGDWRREARAFLELFALTGIAVVQPALDRLKPNANDVFVASGSGRGEILALTAIIVLLPPACLYAIEIVVGLVVPRARRYVHALLAGFVIGVIAVAVLVQNFDWGRTGWFLAAIPFAVGGAYLVLRFDVARMFLRYLAVAPVAFALLFLVSSPVTPLVFSGDVGNADVKVTHPTRVVMVVMDEFPLESLLDGTGHVDAGLFPNFAQLAGTSTWYRNETTVAPYTQAAVPALLTGDYPTKPRALPTASQHPHNLFTLLGNSYGLNTYETLEAMNPSGDATNARGVWWLVRKATVFWRYRVWPPPTDLNASFKEKIPEETIEKQLRAGSEFVRSLKPSGDKHLDYLHVLVPHLPWHFLPDGRSYTDLVTQPGLGEVWNNETLAKVARQRYLLQLQAADGLLGRIVSKLKRIGAYDRSLVVVTADHGEAFTDQNPTRKATAENYPEVMWTPLFIKAAGQKAGHIDDQPAHSIDVLPTVAEMLGVKLPWKVDGRSLLDPPRPDGGRRLLEMPSGVLTQLDATARYQEWDGPKGFARVLATRTAAPGNDQSLRVYKGDSAYGDLVGQAAAPLLDSTAPTVDGAFSDPSVFRHVDLRARKVPWAYVQGTVSSDPGQEIAVSVNGTVASLATTIQNPFAPGSSFVALLPPSLFRSGDNDVRLSLIKGPPEAPHLVPIGRIPS